MKRFKLIHRTVFLLNCIAAISLLLAYISPYIKPTTFWPIAFFGLALPYLFALNIIFLLIWVALGNIRFFLPLIILSLGYKSAPRYFQMHFSTSTDSLEGIKVMSFNVRVFDLYMWSKDKATRNKIFEFLDEEQPDILCLQEFYYTDIQNPKYEFKTLDTLVQFLEAKNYHLYTTNTVKDKNHWGLITFSKYPILNKGLVPFQIKDDNACIYSDIQIGEKIYRVFNTHLASIKLDKHDYKAMQKINDNTYSQDFGDEMLLVNKIKGGFIRRALQADSIHKSIQDSPYPVILCGDFNDTPASYAYETIRGELLDGFIESGSGFGQTYIGEFPSFRIDYILYDNELQANQFTTHAEKLSDHHPISALLYPN